MDLKNSLKKLSVSEDYYDLLNDKWEESVASLPEKTPYYLVPDNICEFRNYCCIESDFDTVLIETAAKIDANPDLKLLSWHMHKHLCEYPEGHKFIDWPVLNAVLGNYAGTFSLLVALGIVPIVQKRYAAKGVPENIIHDTVLEIKCFNDNHKIGNNGYPGIPLDSFSWFRNYVEIRLFRLGRMEYKRRQCPATVDVYRHKKDHKVIALSGDGICYDNDGFVVKEESECACKASLIKTNSSVTGVALSPCGMSLNKTMTLAFEEWEHVLGEGDEIIDVHIPSGGGLTLEACEDSMKRVADFFDNFFPEVEAKAFYCHSWIFNTQLEEILEGSNLVKFMEELYLFPIESSGNDGFRFVFCREYDDLSKAPRDTRLHRGMLDILQNGGKLRAGGMFFLKNDLKHFGTKYYRS
jgi:GNAT domain-containint protein/N-acyltransferase family protein